MRQRRGPAVLRLRLLGAPAPLPAVFLPRRGGRFRVSDLAGRGDLSRLHLGFSRGRIGHCGERLGGLPQGRGELLGLDRKTGQEVFSARPCCGDRGGLGEGGCGRGRSGPIGRSLGYGLLPLFLCGLRLLLEPLTLPPGTPPRVFWKVTVLWGAPRGGGADNGTGTTGEVTQGGIGFGHANEPNGYFRERNPATPHTAGQGSGVAETRWCERTPLPQPRRPKTGCPRPPDAENGDQSWGPTPMRDTIVVTNGRNPWLS